MRVVPLPEPVSPVTLDLDLEHLWRDACEAKNWSRRAGQLDDVIVDALAVAAASGGDMLGCAGCIVLALTTAIESVCDVEIRSIDAALYYVLTRHDEWRAAAREFFAKNKIDIDTAFRARPGARLLRAVMTAHVTLNLAAKAGVH